MSFNSSDDDSQQRFALGFLFALIALVILLTFGWLGWQLSLAAGEKITPILGLKYSWIDLAVPIGAFWMAFHLLMNLIRDIRNNSSNVNGD